MTVLRALVLMCIATAMGGCGGEGDAGAGVATGFSDGSPPAASAAAPATFQIMDVRNSPIPGAVVTLTGVNGRQQATTAGGGIAEFKEPPSEEVQALIEARGFETASYTIPRRVSARNVVTLQALDAWAIGQAILLGSRTIARATDGSSLTVAVDIAVFGPDSQPLQSLTSASFTVPSIDCGWNGPRGCASDAAGKDTAGGWFTSVSAAEAFELRAGAGRRPYSVGVLVERNEYINDWDQRGPALKAFFESLRAPDLASLSAVETTASGVRTTDLGPYTSDGRTYFNAIDTLYGTAGKAPSFVGTTVDAIRRASTLPTDPSAPRDRHILVVGEPFMEVAEIATVTTLAQDLGVKVSTLMPFESYGIPEIAVRTGGFVSQLSDRRQFGYVFRALDSVLAGTMPYYRMQFRVTHKPDTFVPGGNLKLPVVVDIPSAIVNRGTYLTADIAVP